MGSLWGCDRKTCGKVLGNLAEKSLCTYSKNEDGVITILLPKYKYWQDLDVKTLREKSGKFGGKIPPLRAEHTKAEQSKAKQSILSGKKPDDKLSLNVEKEIHERVIQWIFTEYCRLVNRSPDQYSLTDSRRKKLELRLNDFHPVELHSAIVALSEDDWNMGKNPQQKKYVDFIDNLFKSTEEIEKRINEYIENYGSEDLNARRKTFDANQLAEKNRLLGVKEISEADQNVPGIMENNQTPGTPERPPG